MLFGLSSLLLMFYSYLEPFLFFFYQFYLRFREYLMSRPLDHPRILVFFGLSLLFLVFHSFFVLSIVFDSFYLSLTQDLMSRPLDHSNIFMLFFLSPPYFSMFCNSLDHFHTLNRRRPPASPREWFSFLIQFPNLVEPIGASLHIRIPFQWCPFSKSLQNCLNALFKIIINRPFYITVTFLSNVL